MGERFEVAWEGVLPVGPEIVWDAFTRRAAGWLWEITYEPREGGAERGLTGGGGTVTVWEPHRRFVTRATGDDGDVNQLTYVLTPAGGGTRLEFTHEGTISGDYDLQLDACRRHTAFYYHSLGEYVRHFAGRDATYLAADAPAVPGGFGVLRAALGVPPGVAAGDHVRLSGPSPISGVVDYATDTFLGVRDADTLYRFYGRDRWGWPVGVAVHHFGSGAVADWDGWLNDVFSTEAVS